MTDSRLLERIRGALAVIRGRSFAAASEDFLNVLGYRSELKLSDQSGRAEDFIDSFPALNPDTRSEQSFREHAADIRIIFQLTDADITAAAHQATLFENPAFYTGNTQSFLFASVELTESSYPRGQYVQFTREINKRLLMPTVVVFRDADELLTLAFVHRREHKLDETRDVLGSVSLIREIDPSNPHRAHLDILADLALDRRLEWMDKHNRSHGFDGLLAAWLAALDTQELNKAFYKDLYEWFTGAVENSTFPRDQPVTVPAEEHVIRLITRLLFIWFIKEKNLVADDLFIEERVSRLLKDYDRADGDSYYRAVLQNLFFATLNTEIERRGFSAQTNVTHRDFSLYRYKDEMSDLDALHELFDRTPFINGGLFDCLDSEEATGDGGSRIDCFSDNRNHRALLSIPNRLFFGQHGLIDLLNRYKFTVEENTPVEQEVALDPELLGRVFENLLAAYNPETRESARRQTGSYYTPRDVVDYMVDEALIESLDTRTSPTDGNLRFWRERLRYLLDYQDAFDDALELFEPREAATLVEAIAHTKVLDPAVGSGAFPMGVLHKLTLALRRLDPENHLWEDFQKEIALKRTHHAFGAPTQYARDAELREISDTFERYRYTDFGRKLYLIQNSLYGADVQPVACQIAKLRFFISLTIEQGLTDDSQTNYGIRPLPNLETRFVCANTLLSLRTGDHALMSDAVHKLLKQLQRNRERHFHATTRKQKLECRAVDQCLRTALATELQQLGMPENDADRIAQWDPYNHNATTSWFDPEYMLDVGDGFDIVIANPPYVEARNSLLTEELKDAYLDQVRSQWNETLPRGSDLLIYFYARSPAYLSRSGIGCFITQNAWLSTDYGKKFQRFSLGKMSFQRIVDTSSKFFNTDSQNINAVITIFSRPDSNEIRYGLLDDLMTLVDEKTIQADQAMKWGHAISMPLFYSSLLVCISQHEQSRAIVEFGQGLNFPRSALLSPSSDVPVFDKVAKFVADRPNEMIPSSLVSNSRRKRVPALLLPRGIGSRHFCMFNASRAFSHSYVELYLPEDLWGQGIHYCLWAYLNSSFVWLFREITGRKNLGGGMLKAEATDMKSLPISYDFDFADAAKGVFEELGNRDPLPVMDELRTPEHILLDDMVAEFFGFTSSADRIRDSLVEQVQFRQRRAR